ncbi:MAG: ABC transporter substrate-binding protein [Elainellaceae cyanobacterium]
MTSKHFSQSTRRRFLQFSAAAVSGVALSNCGRAPSDSGTAPDASPAASSSPAGTASGPLHIYTWADYSSPALYQRFQEKTGIEVIADVYDGNEVMLAKMQAGGGNQYSILYPSDYMVRQMIELELLTKIDQSRLPGLANLRDRWKDPLYDPKNVHSVPVSWGTTGFIYNSNVLNPGPEDWDYLWENKDKLARKMTLLDDPRETMGAVLKSLGYSYNSTNPTELDAAYQKLRELKPAVRSFESFGWEDRLIAGDLVLCMTYSILGNALPADHPELKYVIPKSGTSVWTDTMVIPTTAPNVDAAYEWMNFMLDPETAAFASSELKFATPNQKAFDLLPAELQSNTNLYPDDAMMATFEGIKDLGADNEQYDKLWTQLKAS